MRQTAVLETEPSALQDASATRLDLLQKLAQSLEQAQAAVARSDFAALGSLTSRQQEICAQLRQFPKLPLPDQGSVLAAELLAVETKVLQLNRAYAAWLRRARRTVDIFCRVLAHSAITYPPPSPPQSCAFPLEE